MKRESIYVLRYIQSIQGDFTMASEDLGTPVVRGSGTKKSNPLYILVLLIVLAALVIWSHERDERSEFKPCPAGQAAYQSENGPECGPAVHEPGKTDAAVETMSTEELDKLFRDLDTEKLSGLLAETDILELLEKDRYTLPKGMTGEDMYRLCMDDTDIPFDKEHCLKWLYE